MKAIILAAGRGSRMGGLTDTQPKGLVSLRGKPLLEWQLASLRAAGIHEIALVTGYRHEALSPYGLPMFHNPDWRRTNMVTSLACLSRMAAGRSLHRELFRYFLRSKRCP